MVAVMVAVVVGPGQATATRDRTPEAGSWQRAPPYWVGDRRRNWPYERAGRPSSRGLLRRERSGQDRPCGRAAYRAKEDLWM